MADPPLHTHAPPPPFDTRAPGVAFGPLWAATRAATRDDFFDSGGGGGKSAGSICFVGTTESVRLSVEVRSIGCPSTARSSVELRTDGISASSSSSSGIHSEKERPIESVSTPWNHSTEMVRPVLHRSPMSPRRG